VISLGYKQGNNRLLFCWYRASLIKFHHNNSLVEFLLPCPYSPTCC
jgi:hypothetical protein